MGSPPPPRVSWYLITGCDTGFGERAVQMLVEARCHVFAGVLKEESKGKWKDEPLVCPVQIDVTSDESVAAAERVVAGKLAESAGQLSGIVNNAGILYIGPVEWMSMRYLEAMYKVNVEGVARTTKYFLPHLRKAHRARIVNVSSLVSRVVFLYHAYYSATKFAVQGICDGLRRELKPFGITVHVVEPGVYPQTGLYRTYAPMIRRLWDEADDEVREAYGEKWMERLVKVMSMAPQAVGNSDPDDVPRTVLHALHSPRPLYRYRCGNDSRFLFRLFSHLPESMQDGFLNSLGKGVPPKSAAPPADTASIYNTKLPYLFTAAASAFLLAKL